MQITYKYFLFTISFKEMWICCHLYLSVNKLYLVLDIFWFPPIKAVSCPNGFCDPFSAICAQ